MSYSNYGIYLIPPPHLLYQIGVAHHLLASEFNARIAGRFMVHCTLKGFFRLKAGATPNDFMGKLDALFNESEAFSTEFTQLLEMNFGEGRASLLLDMHRTEPFLRLHKAIWAIVEPYFDPSCPFTSREFSGDTFPPHVTLAQYDVPAETGLFAQATALSHYIFDTHLRGAWQAHDLQLIEFYSDDWAGDWGDTLRYKQMKGWTLRE